MPVWAQTRRDSSVVEHFHGKEGVLGSNPSRGSISFQQITDLMTRPVINFGNR